MLILLNDHFIVKGLIISFVFFQTGTALHLPSSVLPAQSGAPVPSEPPSSSTCLSVPGLQLSLQPIWPNWTGAVPLHPVPFTLCCLPQLQLVSWDLCHSADCTHNLSNCHPPLSGCPHHSVCCAGHFPPLPPAPARPHAVGRDNRPRGAALRTQKSRFETAAPCDIIRMRQDNRDKSMM